MEEFTLDSISISETSLEFKLPKKIGVMEFSIKNLDSENDISLASIVTINNV